MKTVKEVSEITGVSIRTLRYYDEINLLKPTQLTESGYRLYDGNALEKLQQIMFFKELEIPLIDIREILDHPGYDKVHMLQSQKNLLERKRNRLNGLIELISDVMKGVNSMSFGAFNDNDIEQILDHELNNLPEDILNEIVKQHGSIENYRAFASTNLKDEKVIAQLIKWYGSKESSMAYMNEPVIDKSQFQQDIDEALKQLAQIRDKNDIETESKLVSTFVEGYKKLLCLDNARAFLLDTAKSYIEDNKLKEAMDSIYGIGSTEYLGKAILRYYGA